MRKNKIGTTFILLILALASIGISYSGFSDTIHIYGTVDTATVELEIAEYSGTDVWKVWGPDAPEDELYIYSCMSGNRPRNVDIQNLFPSSNIKLVSSAWAQAGINHNGIEYDIDLVWENIYPNIAYKADFILKYIGSIPAKMTEPDITWESGDDLTEHTQILAYRYTKVDDEWVKGEQIADWPNQVHTNYYIGFEVIIQIPPDIDLQGKYGEFSFEIEVVQWNDQCNDVPSGGFSCLQIKKTLLGSFTDPSTGNRIDTPTSKIALDAEWPTIFGMQICVKNCGSEELNNVLVTDSIAVIFEPIYDPSSDINWDGCDLSYIIPVIGPGEEICNYFEFQTIKNKGHNYHPSTICLIPIWPVHGAYYTGLNNDYLVENPFDNPDVFYGIKFETEGEGFKDGGFDIFEFTFDQNPGVYPMQVELKKGGDGKVGTILVIDTIGEQVSCDDWTVELLEIRENTDKTYTFSIKVTNYGNRACSHVAFSIPCGYTPKLNINDGAVAYVADTMCGELSAKTEAISVDICCISNNIGTLLPAPPVETEWAIDICED